MVFATKNLNKTKGKICKDENCSKERKSTFSNIYHEACFKCLLLWFHHRERLNFPWLLLIEMDDDMNSYDEESVEQEPVEPKISELEIISLGQVAVDCRHESGQNKKRSYTAHEPVWEIFWIHKKRDVRYKPEQEWLKISCNQVVSVHSLEVNCIDKICLWIIMKCIRSHDGDFKLIHNFGSIVWNRVFICS